MALFAFYNFQLTKIGKPTEINFPDLAPKPITTDQHSLFRTLFPEDGMADLHILVPNKDGSYDEDKRITYKNDVYANYGDIIVMNIENNKEKTTIVDKQKVKHKHHPYCYVIIDYRPEQCLLAVEKSIAFDSQPDKLKDILDQTLNRLFYNYGFSITFTPLVQKDLKFWDAITEIRSQNNDKVKKICLDFHNKDKNDKSTKGASCIPTALLEALAKKADANGFMVLEAEEGQTVNVDAIQEDITQIADICYKQKEYDLTVYFSSYGIYRFGADLTAQFGIDARIIQNYIDRIDEKDIFNSANNLSSWLDNMKVILMNKYVNADTIATPAKQGRRR